MQTMRLAILLLAQAVSALLLFVQLADFVLDTVEFVGLVLADFLAALAIYCDGHLYAVAFADERSRELSKFFLSHLAGDEDQMYLHALFTSLCYPPAGVQPIDISRVLDVPSHKHPASLALRVMCLGAEDPIKLATALIFFANTDARMTWRLVELLVAMTLACEFLAHALSTQSLNRLSSSYMLTQLLILCARKVAGNDDVLYASVYLHYLRLVYNNVPMNN
ncbi:hypothetical protein T492DRAFT_841685 [Pavlovales sp. CCMP2436]|nr:hypothetical protein T492DRAFT_841685 [Pavlovales sp. CCMP2436]